MRKADDAVLATRKLKPLPKRSSASVTSSPSSEPQQRFTGFTGFGASSKDAGVFTPPASPSPFPSTSPFSASPSTSNPFAKPAVTSTASSAAKTFSDLLGTSSSSRPAPLTSEPTLPDVESEGDVAVDYFKSLRGLNASILSAITKAVEKDPFTDIASLLERYKTLRGSVQKEYDEKSHKKSSSSSLSTASVTSFSMPTPPASFSGFGETLASSSTAPPLGSGFTPKLDSAAAKSSSPFSFPSTSASAFSFPPAASLASSSKSTESASKPSEPTTNVFSSNPPSSSSTLSFAAPSASGSTSSPFGASTASNPFGSSSFKTPSTSSPFGSPPKLGGFGGFGGGAKASASAGSIGNPVGFGFGSPTKSDNNTSAFSFAKDTTNVKELEPTDAGEAPATHAIQPSEGNEGSGFSFGQNPHDEEGEGEEGEETVHSIRSKAFRMNEGTWADLGTGILRLKKHKETGQRRLLLRNSNTGKIIINFNIYNGLKPTLNKKAVMFVGHEGNGSSQTYNVRTKTEEQASELKNALEREITFVKAKESE
ncbi:hypothetical protein BT96DRAFT_2265 [Gymnopus androsaceus JB14]|uniref:RanBD1 domain-containing protein n=1 Tax=Gymnopus androsaceus JB14 TaxID=1447944 RepID=A0A6A4ITL9_9AGAR|nr:hypothetical protein BT96DRAFT_2265 [Gymnopus androsaceus JB14]